MILYGCLIMIKLARYFEYCCSDKNINGTFCEGIEKLSKNDNQI